MNTQNTWYAPLAEIRSLGSTQAKASNLGGLAEARRQHLGQFFTTNEIARFMFDFVADLEGVDSLLDNSIGSGRLLQFADPTRHKIFGVDVHAPTVDQVKGVFEAAGFDTEIHTAGMEFTQPKNITAALINPPFSVHLESPFLTTYPGVTRMGKYGANSSSISDEYAVMQALEAAAIVVALLPRRRARNIEQHLSPWDSTLVKDRLIAIFDLPANSFASEGTSVSVSIAVFGHITKPRELIKVSLQSLQDEIPELHLQHELNVFIRQRRGKPSLKLRNMENNEPAIKLPVSGNREVSISLDGRKIKFRFHCGLTEAKVQNSILHKRVFSTEHIRLPKDVKYSGQGKMDVEAHLIQDDPVASFKSLLQDVIEAGGIPVLQPGVLETIEKKAKAIQRLKVPLRHTVLTNGAGHQSVVTGVSKRDQTADPTVFISPLIKAGTAVEFRKLDDEKFSFDIGSKTYSISLSDLEDRFVVQNLKEEWKTIHEGLKYIEPERYKMWKARFRSMGLSKFLSWEFQEEDAIELVQRPSCIVGWQQATGKTRLAPSLILLSGVKHGLIVLESRLASELVKELAKMDFDMNLVNHIDSPEKLVQLRKVNVISYERLRSLIDPQTSKRITYAHRLRRRIGMLLADEGEKLANRDSDQSLALFQVSARRKYILTGTPQANVARDMQGLALFVAGDGTALQPYGHHRGYLDKSSVNSMEFAIRGQNAVMEDFVVTEWATWEFTETLRKGAKREIPKINDVRKYREWLAPLLKRRLVAEPDVAKVIRLPELRRRSVVLEWDLEHLQHYVQVCDDFSTWYQAQEEGKRNNLGMILARLQAVHLALNCPQKKSEHYPAYTGGLTSKQRWLVDVLIKAAASKEKGLIFFENPASITVIGNELKQAGVEFVPFHGGIPIAKRVADKDKRFVAGTATALLATKPSARAGYNLPMADFIIFGDRSWSARVESQAIRRPLRAERQRPVTAWFPSLPGSLDDYQGQMVDFKADSERTGIDHGNSETDGVEFLHFNEILTNFIKDLAKLRGQCPHRLREQLKHA